MCRKTLVAIDLLHHSHVCLPEARPGEKVRTPCPALSVFQQGKHVVADCQVNGRWHPHIDYRDCWEQGIGHKRMLVDMYTAGYSLSFISLLIAVVILASFRRLYCTRNFIHIHLFVSGMLKAALLLMKDYFGNVRTVLAFWTHFCYLVRRDVSNLDPDMLTTSFHSSQVGCKVANSLFLFATLAMYFWVLVEALYLHNLLFVSVFSHKKTLKWFVLIGWGAPVLFIIPWIALKTMNDDWDCWIGPSVHPQYQWIYRAPISVIIEGNFLLFLNVVRVLPNKLRTAATAGAQDSGCCLCCCLWPNGTSWRLPKSTLALIPLFGVSGVIFLFMPPDIQGDAQDARLSFDLFFNSFQGFFVAVLFCFLNGEVKAEFQKRWDRWQMSRDLSHQSVRCSRLSSYQIRSTRSNSLALTQISCASPSSGPVLTPDQTPNCTTFSKMAVSDSFPRPVPATCPPAGYQCPPTGYQCPGSAVQKDHSSGIVCDLSDREDCSFIPTVLDPVYPDFGGLQDSA
uniref:Parathyroid hormone receptor-like protein bf173 n=1 Tax=Branchiostoma floridae TaxID=7739 RepID=A0A0E3XHE7_BRAFL|nr:parathyroid hormone receptor-like protein bf173 [Branchiostoma floridae]